MAFHSLLEGMLFGEVKGLMSEWAPPVLLLDFAFLIHQNGKHYSERLLTPHEPGIVISMTSADTDMPLEKLEERLRYRFHDRGLLLNALLHRSYVNENPDLRLRDNERLEFLGDAALDLAISHLLIGRFPDYDEGKLSRLRAGIVNEKQLAVVATELQLGVVLHLGKGEDLSGGRQKPSILANTYEAVLAAIYLDGGLDNLIRTVEAHFSRYFSEDEDLPHALDKDAKTRLQEVLQSRERTVPHYRLEAEEGPDHDKTFRVSVWLKDRLLAMGSGSTKKSAQQKAAGRALRLLEGESENNQN